MRPDSPQIQWHRAGKPNLPAVATELAARDSAAQVGRRAHLGVALAGLAQDLAAARREIAALKRENMALSRELGMRRVAREPRPATPGSSRSPDRSKSGCWTCSRSPSGGATPMSGAGRVKREGPVCKPGELLMAHHPAPLTVFAKRWRTRPDWRRCRTDQAPAARVLARETSERFSELDCHSYPHARSHAHTRPERPLASAILGLRAAGSAGERGQMRAGS